MGQNYFNSLYLLSQISKNQNTQAWYSVAIKTLAKRGKLTKYSILRALSARGNELAVKIDPYGNSPDVSG